MELNRAEWTKAQDLLLQLIQILSPLAEPEKGTAPFLNLRFFIPPNPKGDSEVFRFRYPVCVLKTALHSAQEQVTEWIDQLPAKQEESEAQPPKETLATATAPKHPRAAREGDRASFAHPSPTPAPPLPTQAQKLIEQVRDAIGTLCTSSNIVDPKAAPLREALLRIKPLIDGVIQAVSHEGMHSAGEEPHPHSQFTESKISRIPLPVKQIPRPSPLEPRLEKRSSSPLAERAQEGRGAGHPSSSSSSIIPAASFPLAESAPVRKEGESESRPVVDRLSLPGAPFTPETRTLTFARKKKKKKGFWSFPEDEKEPTP